MALNLSRDDIEYIFNFNVPLSNLHKIFIHIFEFPHNYIVYIISRITYMLHIFYLLHQNLQNNHMICSITPLYKAHFPKHAKNLECPNLGERDITLP